MHIYACGVSILCFTNKVKSIIMNLGLSLKSFAVQKQRFKLINELEVKSIIFNMADLLLREDVHHRFFEFGSCGKSLSLSGGFTPCRHLRPSSGREHTIV